MTNQKTSLYKYFGNFPDYRVNRNKKRETEVRYYISTVEDYAKNYNRNIRQHWGIENKLHWTLGYDL